MSSSRDEELEVHLRDGAWLRSFVATLVPAQEVDDVVQSTWLAAWRDLSVVRNLRQWLRGTAANLARMRHRREVRRMRAVQKLPVDGSGPSSDEVVGALEVQRLVSEALLALPEPTRTIVVLRYQHGWAPAAIGERVGLTADAVRQRLHRGRECVRERLRRHFGDDWRGCLVVLIPGWLRRSSAASIGLTVKWLSAAAVVLLACTLALAAAETDSPPLDAVAPKNATAPVATGNGTDQPSRPSSETAFGERQPAALPQDPRPEPTAKLAPLQGRLVAAEDGTPLVGKVSFSGSGGNRRATIATAADGTFAIDNPDVGRLCFFLVDGRCQRWHEIDRGGNRKLGDIPMARGYRVRGIVVDEQGSPVPEVHVSFPTADAFPDGRRISRTHVTGNNGAFAVDELLPEGQAEPRSDSEGFDFGDVHIDVLARPEPTFVTLVAKRLPGIRGVCFDAAGAPVRGVELRALAATAHPSGFVEECGSCRSEADGSFELFRRRSDSETITIDTQAFAAHELITAPRSAAWGASGLRLVVAPRVPLRLRLVEQDTATPVEARVYLSRMMGTVETSTFAQTPDGRLVKPGLAPGTRLEIWPDDPLLLPLDLEIDESLRGRAEVLLEVERLRPFALELSNAGGLPVQADCDLLQRCGAKDGAAFIDRRVGGVIHGLPVPPRRIAKCTTDHLGKATLHAPFGPRDLVLSVKTATGVKWLPVILPTDAAALRLTLP